MTKKKHTPAYPAELRDRGVRLFRENRANYSSDTAAYKAIGPKLGCSPDSLRVWCQQAERDNGQRAGLTTQEKDRIKDLEREVRELRQANEILKKASAYFAQAELVLCNSRLLRQKGAAAQHRKLRGSGGGGEWAPANTTCTMYSIHIGGASIQNSKMNILRNLTWARLGLTGENGSEAWIETG